MIQTTNYFKSSSKEEIKENVNKLFVRIINKDN